MGRVLRDDTTLNARRSGSGSGSGSGSAADERTSHLYCGKVLVAVVLFAALATTACTARSAYVQPPTVQNRYLITMGDTARPYESLGYLQLTRKGADLFGFISIVDADIQKLFGEELIRELDKRHADGIINLRFRERQWTTAERVLFALPPLFLFPMPTRVELSGELIRFVDMGPPAGPAPAGPLTMK